MGLYHNFVEKTRLFRVAAAKLAAESSEQAGICGYTYGQLYRLTSADRFHVQRLLGLSGRYFGQSRRSLRTSTVSLHQVFAEEPSSWRLFPAKGEIFVEDVLVGPHVFTFETGKLARFASGAVVMGIKETKVLATVVAESKLDEKKGFLPLQVDYREGQYAYGRIPTTFMRREAAPKERELLVGRVIDRSVRPLFPKGSFYYTHIIANVLCSDGEQDPDILSVNAASAALTVSDIPWNGPVGVVRIGRVDGHFLVNPDMDELIESDLNLIYACTVDKTVMVEAQAREVSNNDLKAAFRLAHEEAKKLIPPQLRLASKVQNQKRQFTAVTLCRNVLKRIRSVAEAPINSVMGNPSYGKSERGKALSKIQDKVADILRNEGDEESLKVLPVGFNQVSKQVVRRNIFQKGVRVDGRHLDEVRELYCEAGPFARLHGSSLFSRGNTQVFCTVTLGAPDEAHKLESLIGPPQKHFMLHYNLPPYSINEVGNVSGYSKREVEHGTLAEKALLAVLPPENEFPYSVRVTSEVMASDGSSSMAAVCGGSLALMDAGVPLREHVAGVSVGLVTKSDKSTGKIWDYRILTDTLGLEENIGDMDLKIAGTRNGVTAIQLDIKPAGIPLDMLCMSLEPALAARMHILDSMKKEIKEPRLGQKDNAPRTGAMTVQRESIERLVGPRGTTVKNIQQATGAHVLVNDAGVVSIFAGDQATCEQAKEMVETTIGKKIEVGDTYNGVIVATNEFGAIVELEGGHQGLLHISEISQEKTAADAVIMGQQIKVMCIGQDVCGILKLSTKAMTPPTTQIGSSINSVSISVGGDQAVNQLSSADAISSSVNNVLTQNFLEGAISISNQKIMSTERDSSSPMERTKAKSAKETNRPAMEGLDASDVDLQPESIVMGTGNQDGHTDVQVQICDKKPSVEVGAEYVVSVFETRQLGAVLQMSNGLCGKIFYTKEQGPSVFQVGEQLHAKCERIDMKGRPVFTLLTSE